MLKHVSDAAENFVKRLDDYKVLITKARQNLFKRTERFNDCDSGADVNDEQEKKADVQYTISLDHATGATSFKQKEMTVEKIASVDELVSLEPQQRIYRSSSVSVNTSSVKREENNLKRTSTISNPGNVGRLHPALPKFNGKGMLRRSRAFPSKHEIEEMRKKNPTMIKNAVYCAVILEEFMKELAAISIEQTLQ